MERETSAVLEDKLHEQAVERAKDIIERSLRSFQNPHMDIQSDAHQYQPLESAEEDVWQQISDPALHLMELP